MTTQAPCLGAGKDSQLHPLPMGHVCVCTCMYVRLPREAWLLRSAWFGVSSGSPLKHAPPTPHLFTYTLHCHVHAYTLVCITLIYIYPHHT